MPVTEHAHAAHKAYASWIEAEEAKQDDAAERLKTTEPQLNARSPMRKKHSRASKRALRLRNDDMVARAFCFANRAMWLQRKHHFFESVRRKENRTLDEVDSDPKNRRWYPFQLAFILLNIASCSRLTIPIEATKPNRSLTAVVSDRWW